MIISHLFASTKEVFQYIHRQRYLKYSSETPTFYQNYLVMRNIADETGGKPIAVLLQSISGVSINPLVAFYDIYGGKREVIFFYFVPDTTQDTDNTRGISKYCVKKNNLKKYMTKELFFYVLFL
jgi:hypothetical protein